MLSFSCSRTGLTLLCCLCLLTGCTYKPKEARMLDYLKNRYGEVFVTEGVTAGQYGENYVMLRVKKQDNSVHGILVRCRDHGGKEIFEDNYLGYLLRDEIQSNLTVPMMKIFGPCEVQYNVSELVFPENIPSKITWSEFLQKPEAMTHLLIIPKEQVESKEICIEKMRCYFAGHTYRISGAIQWPDGREFLFAMNEKGAFRYQRWREYQ